MSINANITRVVSASVANPEYTGSFTKLYIPVATVFERIEFGLSKDTKFIVNAPNIYLGIKNLSTGALPTEPAVLGHRLESLLDDLCDFLELFLTDACFNISGIVTPHGTPTGMNPENFGVLDERTKDLNEIRKKLKSIRSRNTKLV